MFMVKKLFLMLFTVVISNSIMATTVTKTTSELVDENNWTISVNSNIGTLATNFQLDENVTVSTTGEANCGSIWGTSPDCEWRIYQNKSGNVTITVSSGKITNIKLGFKYKNGGCLLDESNNQLKSNTDFEVNANSVTFTIGNTGSETNGQIKITSFSVTYETVGTDINNTQLVKSPVKQFDGKQIVIIRNNEKYGISGQRL